MDHRRLAGGTTAILSIATDAAHPALSSVEPKPEALFTGTSIPSRAPAAAADDRPFAGKFEKHEMRPPCFEWHQLVAKRPARLAPA